MRNEILNLRVKATGLSKPRPAKSKLAPWEF